MIRCEDALADFHGLLVLGDEVVVAFGQGLLEALVEHFGGDKGFNLEETTENDHIEQLGDAELIGLVGGCHLVDVDVLAGGVMGNAVGVVDEEAARLHCRLELVHRLLVEDDGSVELVEVGGTDAFVAEDDGDVGGAAAHFRAVGRKPADLLVLHNAGVGQDLTH